MSQLPLGSQFMVPPGFTAAQETIENQFWFQHYLQNRRLPAIVDGSARDAGNTSNTKLLRQGLAMGGPIESGGDTYKIKEWDLTATDGSQFFLGFLLYNLTMYDQLAADQDRYCDILVGGSVYSDYVIVPGNTATGISGNNGNALVAMAQERFLFDKHVKHKYPAIALPPVTLGTSPITLTAADSGRIFTNSGASGSKTVIVPDPLPGLTFTFHDVAGQDIIIDPALADCIVSPGNLLADTLEVDGAAPGSYVTITGISATLYLVTNHGGTVTPAG